MSRTLLTNGMLRKTLAAARSLGKRGVDVDVGEATKTNPSAWSMYVSGSVVYPDPKRDAQAFLRWLRRTLDQAQYDVLFPMDDDVMDVLVAHSDDVCSRVGTLIPPKAVYDLLRDKQSATAAASAHGFRCPETVCPQGESELSTIAQEFGFPLVVKTSFGSGSRGFRVVHNIVQLEAAYAEVQMLFPADRPMIQTYIATGERIDVCLLFASTGERIAGFVQRELRHFPIPHGPSTVQESIRDDALLDACTKFGQNMGWQGIVEFEFMRNGYTGQLYFMEANTRFWNSLHLAVIAGVDFPWLYYQVCQNQQVVPIANYRVGVRCRSVLPADLLHFLANKSRRNLDPPFFSSPPVGGCDDILSLRDPGPVFGYTAALAKMAFAPRAWRDVFRR